MIRAREWQEPGGGQMGSWEVAEGLIRTAQQTLRSGPVPGARVRTRRAESLAPVSHRDPVEVLPGADAACAAAKVRGGNRVLAVAPVPEAREDWVGALVDGLVEGVRALGWMLGADRR